MSVPSPSRRTSSRWVTLLSVSWSEFGHGDAPGDDSSFFDRVSGRAVRGRMTGDTGGSQQHHYSLPNRFRVPEQRFPYCMPTGRLTEVATTYSNRACVVHRHYDGQIDGRCLTTIPPKPLSRANHLPSQYLGCFVDAVATPVLPLAQAQTCPDPQDAMSPEVRGGEVCKPIGRANVDEPQRPWSRTPRLCVENAASSGAVQGVRRASKGMNRDGQPSR